MGNLLGSGGTSLTLAQRFNAGFDNEVKIESREGRKKLSVVPTGLNKEEAYCPALKRWAIFNSDRARSLLKRRSGFETGHGSFALQR
jgi:hypothetical protein